MIESPTTEQIASFYDDKTEALLRRYGPGPVVHYHAGIRSPERPIASDYESVRASLRSSQEALLVHAGGVWDAKSFLSGTILDVGCGLGGGSIHWADRYSASVTAVTIAGTHRPVILEFARQTGVADRVDVVVQDVLCLPGNEAYDGAVAIESTCHMDRPRFFAQMATLLRPGRRLFVADYVFTDRLYHRLWRDHWLAPIGSREEYRASSQDAGFIEVQAVDVSAMTVGFWQDLEALITMEQTAPECASRTGGRVASAQRMVQEGLRSGGLQYVLLSYQLAGRDGSV